MSFVSSNPDCGSAAIREPIITESLDLHGFQSLLEAGRQIITATENQDVLANCLYFSKVLLGASEATLINSEEKNPDPASDLDWDCVQNSIEHKAAVIGKRDPQRRGVICCPIYASGILIAIIHVGPCQTHSTNGSSQRQILGYLASQSGAALEKNEAVRRLKDSNQLLEQQVDDRTRRIRERSESLERTAAALEIACDQANAASRAKSDFIANMSHEIRTPIAAIIGFTDLMLRDMIPEEEIREKLGAILSSGQHLLELVNDILDISKIEANRLELEFLPLNFHDLAEEVFESFRFQASDKDLEFRMELSPNLPEMIRSDPTRLRQVLNNLIGNAVKFTEKGTISIRIYSLPSENPEECHIAVEVIDSGIGISKCQLERIFEAFVQADSSTTRQYGGTGLGLAISRRIAKKLKGGIEASSTPGMGSVFKFRFVAEHFENNEFVFDPRTQELRSLKGMRVLIVDDSDTNREFLRIVLEHAGAVVNCGENGAQGVQLTRDMVPDLVIMDVQMPVMDGISATMEIRKFEPSLPVIALTAKSMKDDGQKCLAAGFSAYLSKPVTPELLVLFLQRFISTDSVRTSESQVVANHAAEEDEQKVLRLPYLKTNKPTESGFYKKLQALADKFEDALPNEIKKFEAAIEQEDFDSLKRFGHAFKGTSSLVGFSELSLMGKQLEVASANRQLAEAKQAIEKIKLEQSSMTIRRSKQEHA